MKIIIHGTGTMGRILKETIESKNEKDLEITGFTNDLKNESGDVIIDFSHFSKIVDMLDYAVKKDIPTVICTTGYDREILNKITESSSKIPIVLSSNTSIGVNLMNDLVSKAALSLSDFDIEIVETHHNKKADSPSGTAKTLYDSINGALNNERHSINGRSGVHTRDRKEIGIHSIRGGTVVGEHRVAFYGEDEYIEIKHTAMSKKIFAVGALKAAKFLMGKKPNLYNMKEVLS